MKGILLDTNFDLSISVKRDANGLITGGLQVGETTNQEAAIVLQMSQGELKEDQLLGIGLTKFVRSKQNASEIEKRIKIHFLRAGIDYDTIKDSMNVNAKTTD